MEFQISPIKECSKCKEFKPLEKFQFLKKRNKYEAECKSCKNKRLNEYYWENHNKVRKQQNEEYYLKNRDSILKYKRKKDAENPFINRFRKLKEYTDVGQITPKQLKQIFEESEGKCWYCNKEITIENFEFDHAVPVARGGTNDPENIRISCRHCNRSKGKMTDVEFNMKRHGAPF